MDGTAALSRSFALFYVCFTSKLFAGVSLSYSSPKTHKDASSPPAAETTVLQKARAVRLAGEKGRKSQTGSAIFLGIFLFIF